jgi:hypothetical protein
MKKLPLYKVVVNKKDEKSGVYAVSLVDEPAIEENWIKLSKEIEMEFAANEDKQMLYGPMLIPNKLIFRRDENGYEYNIMFDAETIEVISNKFNKSKLTDQFNFQHSDTKVEAYLTENWLTGSPDKSQKYGYDLPEGTWFGAIKVEDSNFWNNFVKNEKVKGFSVEILAGAELIEMAQAKIKIKTNLMEIKKQDGTVLYYDGEIAVNTAIFLDPEMTEVAPEGEHILEDNSIVILDAEGKISEIKPEKEEEEIVENEEELVEDEVVVEEEDAIVDEKEILTQEKVIEIVKPMFDEIFTVHAEILTKISDLEAKVNKDNEEEVSELSIIKEKLEKLSKSPGSETLSKKTDSEERKLRKEEIILSKINSFKSRK